MIDRNFQKNAKMYNFIDFTKSNMILLERFEKKNVNNFFNRQLIWMELTSVKDLSIR